MSVCVCVCELKLLGNTSEGYIVTVISLTVITHDFNHFTSLFSQVCYFFLPSFLLHFFFIHPFKKIFIIITPSGPYLPSWSSLLPQQKTSNQIQQQFGLVTLAPHLFLAFLWCSPLSTPPSSLYLLILCNHWSFFDPFGDRCSWAWDRKFSLPSFNLSPPSLPRSLAPLLDLSFAASHTFPIWDLTGRGEFRNTICHSSFSI